MNINDILKNETLTLEEFQKKYMEENSSAGVYWEDDGVFLFSFYSFTKLSWTRSKLILKNISVTTYRLSAGKSMIRYKIECKPPLYGYKLEDTLPNPSALWKFHVNQSKHIEKVMFNGPATILFWGDDTKTVVKNNESQEFDPEKGILYAIIKKLAPNKKLYNEYLRLIDKEMEI